MSDYTNPPKHKDSPEYKMAQRAVAAEARVVALEAFARFIVTLDDPRAVELRRSISLNEIVERARAVLDTGKRET